LAIVFSPTVLGEDHAPRKPIFITDSRYKLQSSMEVDQTLFDI